MSIHCPDCGAVASYGHEIGHKRDCSSLYREPRRTLTDGRQIYPGHCEIIDKGERKGQQRDYVVLAEEERANGFVRPVRRSYTHLKCGGVTTMGQTLAETYARDPAFYSGTFCCHCGTHFPVGAKGEFVWTGTDEKVGT